MKSLISSILLSIVLLSPSAFARSFYKAEVKLSVSYNSLNRDTVMLLENHELDVRYSDDLDYCFVYVGENQYECHAYHPEADPTQAQITMDRGVAGNMIADALGQVPCDPEVHQSFVRLATYLSDTIDLEHAGQNFYQQIHDEVPESFHVWLFDLTKGVKY